MKRTTFIFSFLLVALVVQSQSQNGDLLNRIGVSAEDLDMIEQIQRGTNRVVLPARTEIQLIQADLSYLLSREDIDMQEIEVLLRKSLEFELTIRLAEIKMQIEIRNSLGSETWTRLMQTAGRLKESGGLSDQIARSLAGSPQRRLLIVLRGMLRN